MELRHLAGSHIGGAIGSFIAAKAGEGGFFGLALALPVTAVAAGAMPSATRCGLDSRNSNI